MIALSTQLVCQNGSKNSRTNSRFCCPRCQSTIIKKSGFFARKTTNKKRVQRYKCNMCNKSFSTQTFEWTYRERKSRLNQQIFRDIVCGMSQRRIALRLNINRKTVANKLKRIGKKAMYNHFFDMQKHKAEFKEVFFELVHNKCYRSMGKIKI